MFILFYCWVVFHGIVGHKFLNHSPIEGHLDCLLRNSLFFFSFCNWDNPHHDLILKELIWAKRFVNIHPLDYSLGSRAEWNVGRERKGRRASRGEEKLQNSELNSSRLSAVILHRVSVLSWAMFPIPRGKIKLPWRCGFLQGESPSGPKVCCWGGFSGQKYQGCRRLWVG